MTTREAIIAQLGEIPALPTAAVRVMAQINNPDSSMGDIMDALSLDPGLTSNVLRMANSAYFAGPRKIASLREAGVLFGTQRLQHLVLTSAVAPMTQRPIRGYDVSAEQMVENLVATAIAADSLNKLVFEKPDPIVFTAGLLHGIGKIVLGTFVAVDAEPILALANGERLSFNEAEQRVLGIDHAEVGALLLEKWNIPEALVTAVRYQFEPEKVNENTRLVDLVHVATILALQCGLGTGLDGLHYRVSDVAAQRLELTTAITERVTCTMLSELASVRDQIFAASEGS